jgi:hypothetical protein
VVEAGAILSLTDLGDACGTKVNTVCSFHGGEEQAVLEQRFEFPLCCVDEEGVAPLGTEHLDPATCSRRSCERGPGRVRAAWVIRQQVGKGRQGNGHLP